MNWLILGVQLLTLGLLVHVAVQQRRLTRRIQMLCAVLNTPQPVYPPRPGHWTDRTIFRVAPMPFGKKPS